MYVKRLAFGAVANCRVKGLSLVMVRKRLAWICPATWALGLPAIALRSFDI